MHRGFENRHVKTVAGLLKFNVCLVVNEASWEDCPNRIFLGALKNAASQRAPATHDVTVWLWSSVKEKGVIGHVILTPSQALLTFRIVTKNVNLTTRQVRRYVRQEQCSCTGTLKLQFPESRSCIHFQTSFESGKTYIQSSACSFSLTCSDASGVNASGKRALLLQ